MIIFKNKHFKILKFLKCYKVYEYSFTLKKWYKTRIFDTFDCAMDFVNHETTSRVQTDIFIKGGE